MRWSVFAIFTFVAIVLELSLRNVFRLEKLGGISPSFIACLAVYVSLFAHRLSVMWGCWLLGLLMDLAPAANNAPPIIGPNALGYVFGGLLILQLRTMVFRRRSITLGALTLTFLLAASIAAVAILVMRGWFYPHSPLMHSGALSELLRRFGITLYSGIVGIPLGWLLLTTLPVWGFQSNIPGRTRGW
jgi:cell shape-determining protein MreD